MLDGVDRFDPMGDPDKIPFIIGGHLIEVLSKLPEDLSRTLYSGIALGSGGMPCRFEEHRRRFLHAETRKWSAYESGKGFLWAHWKCAVINAAKRARKDLPSAAY